MKIAYEQVAIEVEKLYQKQFDDKDIKAIEEHCLFIQSFVESTGWEVDSFMARWLNNNSCEVN